MKLIFDVGKQEKTKLIIKRNWFTGEFTYTENGIQQTIRSALHPSTHFNVRLTKYYIFEVGTKERYHIEIRHTRPLLVAGFRPQIFEIKIDGKVVEKYKGY